ncbi:MAG TPA: ferrochelatase [Usitatibacter sp.]|nr:ferrochelatase [Usitatibacter sp.]
MPAPAPAPPDGPAATTGVLLVNLGTPEAPTRAAVRRYLREFLMDPRVVGLPRIVWWPILNLLVLPLRSAKTARRYASIWSPDGSPLRVNLMRQAQLLRGYLGQKMKKPIPVAAAMRYGKPSIAEGLAELQFRNASRVLVIPLYPQYSESATASVEDELARSLSRMGSPPAVRVLKDFHAHDAYVKAIAANVNAYWMKHGRPEKLLMSFHGLPRAAVEKGDPYEAHCRASAGRIATELGWNDERTVVSFQSRFGAQEWLKPYTADVLAELGRTRLSRLDVICPGFTADCLETLEEIAQLGRDTFRAAGGGDFHYIPTTNDTPSWMTALTIIAMENLEAWRAGEA